MTMSSERYNEVARIFTEARAMDDPERSAFLDDACGSDAALREAVERLLAHDRDPAMSSPDALTGDGPEMLARAKFLAREETTPGGSIRQRVFAPSRFVRPDEDGASSVLVVAGLVDGRGRVERRTVVAGARQIDDWIEIDEGLRVGDLVIADPPPGLSAGDRVRVVGEAGGGGV